MPNTEAKTKEPSKNLHIDVPESFHKKIKMLCVVKGCTLKSYLLAALKDKVAQDDREMREVEK